MSNNPERAQYWSTTTGQLLWEYNLPESKSFGTSDPFVWEDGTVALFVEKSKLVKLSIDGEELWTWTRKANDK